MFNRVLNLIMENEKVEVYEKETIEKNSGGTSISWVFKKNILCNIQADSKYGDVLANSQSGDKIEAVYNIYTESEIKVGQRIKRGRVFYEIRNVEHNGIKTILEHYKGYLTRVTQ